MKFPKEISHRQIRKGDSKAFEKLFRQGYEPLCRYAYSFTKDMDEAEDIVQELFVNYWNNRAKIRITVSLKSYLYQATKNSCLNLLRHKKVRERYADRITTQKIRHNSYSALEAEELTRIVEETLNNLPKRCKEVFMMSRMDGLKYKEISEQLSISIKTVEADMGKALREIRSNLAKYDN